MPGIYDVRFSISAPDAGGIFYAQLSGQNLGVIDVPSTGGWYSWEDIPSQRIEIAEGEKFLKIQIVQASLDNLNFKEFLPFCDLYPLTWNIFPTIPSSRRWYIYNT